MKKITLSVKEVAEVVGVSEDFIYTLVRLKEIPCVRVGRRVLFRVESIDDWLKQKEIVG
jgi:excisionase family DNA binding protein